MELEIYYGQKTQDISTSAALILTISFLIFLLLVTQLFGSKLLNCWSTSLKTQLKEQYVKIDYPPPPLTVSECNATDMNTICCVVQVLIKNQTH